jgi:hypothetical protein
MLCDFSSELEFVPSHFSEIARNTTNLNSSIISAILSHRSLMIESEDVLYDYVMNSSHDHLEFIHFEYLSPDVISEFLDNSCIEDLNLYVIRRLISRLVCQHLNVPSDGITQLTRKCGGNVHDCGIVTVMSSMLHNYQQVAKNVTDNSRLFFNSGRRPSSENIAHERNNWIYYDFKNQRIIPTHYSIRLYDSHEGNAHPETRLLRCRWTVTSGR